MTFKVGDWVTWSGATPTFHGADPPNWFIQTYGYGPFKVIAVDPNGVNIQVKLKNQFIRASKGAKGLVAVRFKHAHFIAAVKAVRR